MYDESKDKIRNYYYAFNSGVLLLSRDRQSFDNADNLNTRDSSGMIQLLNEQGMIEEIYKKSTQQRVKFIYNKQDEYSHTNEVQLLQPPKVKPIINYKNLYEITYTKKELVYIDDEYTLKDFYENLQSINEYSNSLSGKTIELQKMVGNIDENYLIEHSYNIEHVNSLQNIFNIENNSNPKFISKLNSLPDSKKIKNVLRNIFLNEDEYFANVQIEDKYYTCIGKYFIIFTKNPLLFLDIVQKP